ncbi:hypothetical protein FHS31_000532 [Sphingomonas vulcanisoli]|uniref:Ice-binding protein C-terminal domain-containing protein n=1 Tax=Sphingomonas vulcanisoli TaxID=1658060 RepID=A0ABX0TQT7_9SPHN|nr:PEPxxWA-CTERM sorting domain-containing protein [Sphingomonas vulcanisoli]NIJ06950.1 hypothetical protein [Sphingomonas vulcanisoli]
MINRLLTAAAIVMLGTAAQAVVIPDGSFETPATSSFVYNPTVTGVTFNAGSGVQHNGSAWAFADAPDGTQTAFIQSTSSYIGQIDFALTGLTVGQVYQIVFAGAARPGGYSDNPFTVSVGGSQIGSYDITSTIWSTYTTPTFRANSTTGTLTFVGSASSGDADVGIDNVRITTAPVPEPATWAMMIGGFGLVGTALRRSRRMEADLA